MQDLRGQIASLLAETASGEPWHGASVDATLGDLTPAQAAAHPIAGAHSIAETVRHMAAWNRVIAARLTGEEPELTPDMDWPTARDADPRTWSATLTDFADSVRVLTAALARAEETWFHPGGAGFERRLARNALGSLTHLTWHAGQITMLRRAQGLPPYREA